MIPSHDDLPADIVERLHVHLAALYRPGLASRLMDLFGSAERVLRQSALVLRAVPGMAAPVLAKLTSGAVAARARREVRQASEAGVRFLCRGLPDYPPLLRELEEMPPVLYLLGPVELVLGVRATAPTEVPDPPEAGACEELGRFPAVGIVGSRRPTPYGVRQARAFAAGLARRGFTVISGLAAGIDGEAHRASVAAGGRTVAVLGAGLDRIYPRQHASLARSMVEAKQGALVSEFPFGTAPKSFHFPMRNRIISGLADGLLVVEAGERSGSLITARYALDQGRTIHVVPGRIGPEALGGLRLLVDGAVVVLGPEDVFPFHGGRLCAAPNTTAMEPGDSPTAAGDATLPLSGPYARQLERLFREEDAWHPDVLATRLGAPAGEVLAELTRLELEGRLERIAGGAYTRC